MSTTSQAVDSGPVSERARIISLDLIRGVAVLGILLMNAVSFKLGSVPYFNLSAGGSETWLDWAVGIFGEIFIDQKFMGLFSLLFGAGMMIFTERAEVKGIQPALISLWRNALLLGIGVLHFLLWEGDVLMLYAISSAIVVLLRKLHPKLLVIIGVAVFVLSMGGDIVAQLIANTSGVSFGGIWTLTEQNIDALISFGYLLRALGMILIGAGLYKVGFMNGGMPTENYRRIAATGLVIGLSLATVGVVVAAVNDYSRGVEFIGRVPNTLGTIPASLGYMSLIILWNARANSWLKNRLLAVGRMALTNYLTQTILGVLILTMLLEDITVNRTGILLFVLAVWALQIWWSQAWLSRFLFGPAEWLWRVATYRRMQPILRT